MSEGTSLQLYLGLPNLILRQKRQQFSYIKDRVTRRIMEWNQSKDFSNGGKEVLIKAVIQAIPTYAMQCFKLPTGICDDIQRACASFWWNDKDSKRGMHWMRWKALCRPKELGGMGFKDMSVFNKALLAKQLWRMIVNPDSLVARVFKARYCKDSEFMDATAPQNCSYVWRSIIGSKEVLIDGMRWKVGDGTKIHVFRDRWVHGLHDGSVTGKGEGECPISQVKELLTSSGTWNEALLHDWFPKHEIEGIRNTPIGESGDEDRRWWKHEPNGLFTVKSAYRRQMEKEGTTRDGSSTNTPWWKTHVWKINTPPKVKIFLWRAMNNVIPTEANLQAHHVPTNGICTHCKDREASTEHRLLFCPLVKKIWTSSRF